MCGVIGIIGPENSAVLAGEALFSMQHRGQDSCGIALWDGTYVKRHRGMGLVREVLYEGLLKDLRGNICIGHVRYPTTGAATLPNAQPHLFPSTGRPVMALASNGDIVNYKELRAELEADGIPFLSGNDGELLVNFIGREFSNGKSVESSIKTMMEKVKGAYSAVLLYEGSLYAFKDPLGIRPLILGEIEGMMVACSESVALDVLRCKVLREIGAGECVKLHPETPETLFSFISKEQAACIFELIYFSRPDSILFNQKVFEFRQHLGELLAEDEKIQGDMVIPIPDSSNYIAMGFARKLNLPIELGLVRNHYVGRTFIAPEQRVRDEGVRQKFNPLPGIFKDKRIFLVDDSIVRGTTLRKLCRMIKENGAKEIHVRIGSPPIRHSCFYGIDTPIKEYLIAHGKETEDIRKFLTADSLRYLSMENLRKVTKTPDSHCYACFNGNYPAGKP